MATWIAHMRVAECLMRNHPELDNDDFLVGNIGPDCGVPNEDWSAFTPDKQVSHWMTDGKNIDAADFLRQYKPLMASNPFYTGYYFHLLTDIEWSKLFLRKKLEPLHAEGFAKDKGFIWTIKKDWYGQDHLYVKANPQSIFHTRFARIQQFNNTYFDFYPANAFTRQIKYITNFYQTAEEDGSRPFPYLSKAEMDAFVAETAAAIEKAYSEV